MLHLKEKFAVKLSRLLADSPASSPRATPTSPVVRSESEVPSFAKEEIYHSGSPSFSPLLASLTSTVNRGRDGHKSGLPNVEDDSPSSSRLCPSRWRSNHFSWKERPLEQKAEFGFQNGGYETLGCSEEEDDHVSEMNLRCPRKSAVTSTVPDLPEASVAFTGESSFISPDLYEFLHSCIPNIVKGCEWVLLYSTMKHGISLRTLLRKSSELSGPCLLIVGDKQGAVFGGLLECPINPTTKRKYQGTNGTFVFTTKYGEPRLFRATGANRYYYLCLNDLLAFGGGGSFALSLDDDLLHGTSGPCETFGNLCLAHNPEFELKNVERWAPLGVKIVPGRPTTCLALILWKVGVRILNQWGRTGQDFRPMFQFQGAGWDDQVLLRPARPQVMGFHPLGTVPCVNAGNGPFSDVLSNFWKVWPVRVLLAKQSGAEDFNA